MWCYCWIYSGWFKTTSSFSFTLDKAHGYKVFCDPETIQFKKRKKSVLNTITFYSEDDNHEEVDSMEKQWLLQYKR